MKLIVLAIGIILFASVSFASPFLVCDPQTGVDHYKLTGPAWVPTSTPAQADGSLKMDVASSAVGLNSLTVAACINDPVWGELCSVAIPFVYTRPAPPVTTSNIRLTP